ncbi:hypothetical protein OG242_26785 [Streptomyces sp. NBC_00727]|uniref:hypothetical protein n=1 Tax=Streptomyces sp. NBC_00727 TaxID=2903675 RepID=UPI003863958A
MGHFSRTHGPQFVHQAVQQPSDLPMYGKALRAERLDDTHNDVLVREKREAGEFSVIARQGYE